MFHVRRQRRLEREARAGGEGSVRIELLVAGDGKSYPKPGQTATLHYTGYRPDGTTFDSTHDRGRPFSFTLGQEQVVKGLDVAVSRLSVGDVARVVMEADMAYGKRGFPGLIPPRSALTFEIELLKVK